jgi:aarF domain-containing kinase
VGESIQSDLWSMKQLVLYTGLVPEGLFLDRVAAPARPLPRAARLGGAGMRRRGSKAALRDHLSLPPCRATAAARGRHAASPAAARGLTVCRPRRLQVLKVAHDELLQECDYERERASTHTFKVMLAPYPEFAVPAVVPSLSSTRVLTTEWMEGLPIDRAAAEMTAAERNRVGGRLLWLSLMELFRFRFMQTDPNWSNFLYAPRTLQLSLIDFGACQAYDAHFADEYLRLVRACAEGHAQRDAIIHHSTQLGFLTGQESALMLEAHVNAAVLVGSPFAAGAQPFDFGAQNIARRVAADVSTMIKHRLTPPREEIYTLHRRLNGCFQLAARVGATIPARDILLSLHDTHEWAS